MQLLCTRTVPIKEPPDSPPERLVPGGIALAKLYVLADKFQDNSSKNAIMDTMLCKVRTVDAEGLAWMPGTDIIRIIYDGTGGDCAARWFLVDLAVQRMRPGYLTRFKEQFPKEFLFDVALSLMYGPPKVRKWWEDVKYCDARRYHEEEREDKGERAGALEGGENKADNIRGEGGHDESDSDESDSDVSDSDVSDSDEGGGDEAT